MLAPIVIFAFNRRDALENTIRSLLANTESVGSDLFVFVDGPREGKSGEAEKVEAVREFVRGISELKGIEGRGFRSVQYSCSEINKGLGPSIIAGVSEVMRKYGKAIVVEDDLVLACNFLAFMNQALVRYENNPEVFSICGYSSRVKVPKSYSDDAYFCVRSSSWGWATWADRWESVDWELDDWETHRRNASAFNRWGGSDCFRMLRNWHNGRNKSWAIRFCYNQFFRGGLSLFPLLSKVDNRGFDGKGTNCKKWSRFKLDFDLSSVKNFRFPENVVISKKLYRSAMSYHSLAIRAWSKLMYIIHR